MSDDNRIKEALEIAREYGGTDGAHHKDWVIDQMVRALTSCPKVKVAAQDFRGRNYTFEGYGESDEYKQFVADAKAGEDGAETYSWSVGIAP